MDDFDKAMEEVLKRGKYNILTGRFIDWRERLFAFLRDVLDWILEHLHLPKPMHSTGGSDWLVNIFIIVAVGLLLLIAGLVLYFVIRRRNARKTAGDIFQGIARGLTPEGLLQAGADLAGKENIREAIRYCFAALLLALDSRKIIRIGHSKTNRQLKRELKNTAPILASPFDRTADIFNMTWFGHKEYEPEQFNRFWEQTADLVRQVGKLETGY